MTQSFDLFGDPIAANHGGRGRPSHVPTKENRNQVNLLLACGWSNERIAGALRITLPTLRRHYFSELKYRTVARDRLDLRLLAKAFEGVEKHGRIAPFLKLLERNDLMNFGQTSKPITSKPADAPEPEKAKALGKKEAALLAAHEPDQGTPMGELIARRQQRLVN